MAKRGVGHRVLARECRAILESKVYLPQALGDGDGGGGAVGSSGQEGGWWWTKEK